MNNNDIVGKKFGRLTVCSYSHSNGYSKYYLCKCDCGNQKTVFRGNILYGKTLSCGCLQRERAIEYNQLPSNRMQLHRILNKMISRCENVNDNRYYRYGLRGISVCDEWQSFEPFYQWAISNGYADNLTIDRIDVNGNYEPSNCRWTTSYEQSRNKRTNHYIEINGEKKVITDVALEHGISCESIVNRLNKGYSIEEALTKEKPKKRLIYYKGDYFTPRQFSEITGINYNTISSRMTKGYSSAENLIIPNRNVFLKKPVKQYDLNGNFIASYSSASEAAKENKCCKSGVIECCNGKKKKFKNWVFCYEI